MRWIERALRNFLKSVCSAIWILPNRFAVPLANILVEVPKFISEPKGYDAVVSYLPLMHSTSGTSAQNTAIIVQGPIEDSLAEARVLTTVEHYQGLFPGVTVVVSTWSGAKVDLLKEVAGLVLVESDDPGSSYPSNIVRQQVSTYAGIAKAAELGVSHVAKTRVDHRLTDPGALAYLHALLRVAKSADSICVSSYGSGRYRLFGFTEQLQFGRTETLLEYWRGKPDIPQVCKLHGATDNTPSLELLGSVVHETLLNVRYLERCGFKVEWTWASNLKALKSYFAIADSSSLGHLQLGRTRTVYNHVYPWNDKITNQIENHLQTSDWLALVEGLDSIGEPDNDLLLRAMKVPPKEVTLLLRNTETTARF